MGEFTFGALKRARVGQVTLNGTTEVTISVPNLDRESIVLQNVNTIAGTPGASYISSLTPGIVGTIGLKSSAGDTSILDIYVYQ